ncbi:MAG: hypothetical protein M1836_002260 [Candelina mexicana]|nr:MAG: hypothetical protein M1836_002260 [Candelina mexicana]
MTSLIRKDKKCPALRLSPHPVLAHFVAAFVPSTPREGLRSPAIPPFYANLGELGNTLFLYGKRDPLLDGTVLMGVKLMTSGIEGVFDIFEGATHGFTAFGEGLEAAVDAKKITAKSLREKLENVRDRSSRACALEE